MFQTGVFEEFLNVARVSNMFEAPDMSDPRDCFFGAADQTGFWNLCTTIRFLCSGLDFLVFVFKNLKTFRGRSAGTIAQGVIGPAQPPWALKHHPCCLQARRGQGRWLGVQRLGVYTGGVLPHALKHRVCKADRGFTLAGRWEKEVLQTPACVQVPTALKLETLA